MPRLPACGLRIIRVLRACFGDLLLLDSVRILSAPFGETGSMMRMRRSLGKPEDRDVSLAYGWGWQRRGLPGRRDHSRQSQILAAEVRGFCDEGRGESTKLRIAFGNDWPPISSLAVVL